MPTYYEVLRVSTGASLEEIRSAYKQRLLDVHPDKQNAQFKATGRGRDSGPMPTLVDVQQAWNVLSNCKAKEEYDFEQEMQRRRTLPPSDVIALADMQQVTHDGTITYTYECRCGANYCVEKYELEFLKAGPGLLECEACGNVLHICPGPA